ncbi:MAG: hypothetical protein J6S63_04700 [Atopobiaceae bacterium]|nr:hypothetical protein [Atopobiaceae bacterium]
MDAKEFATRMVTDEAFMVEITRDMPDEVFAKDAGEDAMVRGMAVAAAKRGWDFGEEELKEHYNEALKGLGAFGVIKYIKRFLRVAKAAGKSKKDLKARGIKA